MIQTDTITIVDVTVIQVYLDLFMAEVGFEDTDSGTRSSLSWCLSASDFENTSVRTIENYIWRALEAALASDQLRLPDDKILLGYKVGIALYPLDVVVNL